ncbi:MAG: glycosyltransferase family 2 protein [Spirochaetia bacterium]|nr:glycosyltransferase family 2 protein [Spirochaetia bacterium]
MRISILSMSVRLLDKIETSKWMNKNFPGVSIIVTACNEESTIESALTSLLNMDYPDYEVIAVNDRSTDKTAEILKKLSKKYKKLHVLHIKTLPEGWLGKVHALDCGVKKASKKWMLFTDADVHYSESALKKCIIHSELNNLDHFTVAPRMTAGSFLLKIMFRTFSFMFIFIAKGIPEIFRKNIAVGVGAFNLVRKQTFDKTEGFPWLKMEVADDVGLALMFKRAGAKTDFAFSIMEIQVAWYHSFMEMVRGLEKNIFGVSTGYKLGKAYIDQLLSILLFCSIPAAAFSDNPVIILMLALVLFFLVLSAFIHFLRFNESFTASLFVPFGFILLTFINLRAGILCMRNGGIRWRGTFYKIEELKASQRVRTSF